MSTERTGAYGPDDDIIDYILGITYEIWEERGVELIHQYYGADCIVWGMDGITHGAQTVVDATWTTLGAFPDRKLILEHVIWSGNREDGYYTSHRLLSTGTNKGASPYGPATGRSIRMTNIADCFVENGVITREWLVRDSMMFVTQLGADPLAAARDMRAARTHEHQAWLDSEHARVRAATTGTESAQPNEDPEGFARAVLRGLWTGDRSGVDAAYAPYCVLHRSPFDHHSGRDAVFDYYANLRRVLGGDVAFSVDHVAHQPLSTNGIDIAVRWTAAGTHGDAFYGAPASAAPMFIMGVTHWRCAAGRIISESTVFDDLALLSQVVAP